MKIKSVLALALYYAIENRRDLFDAYKGVTGEDEFIKSVNDEINNFKEVQKKLKIVPVKTLLEMLLENKDVKSVNIFDLKDKL
jgi:hypothetical protein